MQKFQKIQLVIYMTDIKACMIHLAAELKALIELSVSLINGCDYCCNLHRNEAVKLGVNQDKIESLPEFTPSNLFSDAEKEALKLGRIFNEA